MLNKQYSNLKINIEKYPNNTQKTIEIMSKNNIIIGLRYHSILIAHALAIPCIPICYDINEEYEYKIKHLNEMLKKEEALSYKNIDFNGLIEQIKLAKNIDTNILRAIAIKIEEASQKQMLEIVNKLLKDDD